MTDIIIACVWTKGSIGGVTRLRNAVEQHTHAPYTMVCLTDQPERCSGVAFVDISAMELTGWWNKMALFEPQWRGWSKVIYLDLEATIIGDIASLANVPGEFSIRQSADRHGCKYDSSVMVIGGGLCGFMWDAFEKRRAHLTTRYSRYGDRACIEELNPHAQLLQRVLPKNFFSDTLITKGERQWPKDHSQALRT